jgi:Family of unknown function (DUF6510)
MATNEPPLRLDGNACAGLLAEIFTNDLTAARGACSGCGTVAQFGSRHLYGYPAGPGAVLRCETCQNVPLVVVDTGPRYRLALAGITWLEIEK